MAAQSKSGFQFVCPPNWPQPPEGWTPPEGWQPDPGWGPAPEGWRFWQLQVKSPVDGFATATLFAGILGSALFAAIFGAVALYRIRRNGRSGRKLVYTGFALSLAWLFAGAAFLAWGGMLSSAMTPKRSPTGAIISKGRLPASELRVGDCLKVSATDSTAKYYLDVMPCGELHNAQVYDIVTLAAGAYPGDDPVTQLGLDACEAKVAEFFAADAEISPTLRVYTFANLAQLWNSGDRRARCLFFESAGDFTGDVRDR